MINKITLSMEVDKLEQLFTSRFGKSPLSFPAKESEKIIKFWDTAYFIFNVPYSMNQHDF